MTTEQQSTGNLKSFAQSIASLIIDKSDEFSIQDENSLWSRIYIHYADNKDLNDLIKNDENFVDGHDHGIDYWQKNENTYSIYQFKMKNLENSGRVKYDEVIKDPMLLAIRTATAIMSATVEDHLTAWKNEERKYAFFNNDIDALNRVLTKYNVMINSSQNPLLLSDRRTAESTWFTPEGEKDILKIIKSIKDDL